MTMVNGTADFLTKRESKASMRVMAIPPWLSCPEQLIGRSSSCSI